MNADGSFRCFSKMKGSDNQEKLVYQVIEDAGNKGDTKKARRPESKANVTHRNDFENVTYKYGIVLEEDELSEVSHCKNCLYFYSHFYNLSKVVKMQEPNTMCRMKF